MAKYSVTYSCAHTETVRLIGPHRDREWRLSKMEGQLCPECYRARLAEERAARSAEAAEANAAAELPELTGSAKQIAWAETIRKDKIDRIEAAIEAADKDPEPEYRRIASSVLIDSRFRRMRVSTEAPELQQGLDWVLGQSSAHWWIENRERRPEDLLLLGVDAALKTPVPELAEEARAAAAEALAEATLRPERAVTETVAEILAAESSVELRFPEKREDFRQVVRFGLGYTWETNRWLRKVTKWAGDPRDRAAEAGRELLAKGFVVRILDPVVREKAVSGDFEPECTRWVKLRVADPRKGWFAIAWGERNEKLYAAARKLPGSRYEKGEVLVPSEQYEQVIDFAELNGFRLSDGAREAAEEAQRVREESLLVRPQAKKPATATVVGGKPATLTTPASVPVLNELRD